MIQNKVHHWVDVQINIMQNQQIKEKIEEIWHSIKSSKAGELEQHLSISRQRVEEIIGSNEIQKIRHSSLLKLLIYELIVFADDKLTTPVPKKTSRRGSDNSKSGEKSMRSLTRLEEIKELLCTMSLGKSAQGEIVVDIDKFKMLLQRVRSLQKDLLREEEQKKKAQKIDSSDSQGTEIMIEQLEDIVKRKQNRINELYRELQQNFNDKQQLEEEIDVLQLKNTQLTEKIKELSDSILSVSEKSKELQLKYSALAEQFDKYKHKEKEQLLFGVNSFMNNELPIKRNENNGEDTTVHDDPLTINNQPISNSTKILYKYCFPSSLAFSNNNNIPQEKTVKKRPFKMIQSECESEEELLISIKPESKHPVTLENSDHSLERLLLMQALFIEKALEDILS